MRPDPRGLMTGRLFIDGDHACSEGAIAAGCRFAAGYPITPSTEIIERLAMRFPLVGGTFIRLNLPQMTAFLPVQPTIYSGDTVRSQARARGAHLIR